MFPLALEAVARQTVAGQSKYGDGGELSWDRDKSPNHLDSLMRHMLLCGQIDHESGELHDTALAWRALAHLQLAEEKRREALEESEDGN